MRHVPNSISASSRGQVCTDVKFLGEALDRWEALGREITRPIDEDFWLLALRELVPHGLAELMTTQVSLKSCPEALMYIRSHVTDQRHASEVEVVRQQGRAPMHVSSLTAEIAQLRAETCERGRVNTEFSDQTCQLEVAIVALGDRAGVRESKG